MNISIPSTGPTIVAIAVTALVGCAHTAPVIPQEGGIFVAHAEGDSKEDALKQGLHTAQRTCEQRGKLLIVVDSNQEYTGIVSEKTGATVSKVRDIAGPLSIVIPSLTDGDFKLQLTFKCE